MNINKYNSYRLFEKLKLAEISTPRLCDLSGFHKPELAVQPLTFLTNLQCQATAQLLTGIREFDRHRLVRCSLFDDFQFVFTRIQVLRYFFDTG